MLSRFLLRASRNVPRLLPMWLAAPITTVKGPALRKKLYESQVAEVAKQDEPVKSVEERRNREVQFQKLLFELAKELTQIYSMRSPAQKKISEIKNCLSKSFSKLQRDHGQLEGREVLQLAEVVKCISLLRSEELGQIEAAYSVLEAYLMPKYKKTISDLAGQGWETIGLQLRIRAISLLQFMGEGQRQKYLGQAAGLVRYFKSAEMLMVMYQKWRFGYLLSYEFLDQIHKNQYFCELEEVGQAYIKMLFIESIRETFGPNEDGIFSRVLNVVADRPNLLLHSAFSKLIKMLHSQIYYLQTESSRMTLEISLNNFINIAKNQNYDHSNLSLTQLVEIFLGFEESCATGEILLSQITYSARVTELKLTQDNFPLFQQLLLCVARNIEPKLKYERIDSLNKEYTNDTVNFLRQLVPKYLPLWPEVILHLNHAAHELFRPNDPLLQAFATTFSVLAARTEQLSLINLPFLTSMLRFLKTHQHHADMFQLPDERYLAVLGQYLRKKSNEISNQEIESLYLVLSLLGKRIKSPPFRTVVQKVYKDVVEARIEQEMARQKNSSAINSFDQEVLWLTLCSALVKAQGFSIDESMLEVFINQKVYALLNSLKYLEVAEMFEFAVGLSRLKPEVYERLLYGLSTFLIYISQRPKGSASSFYLNRKYTRHYHRLCRLVLDNHTLFRSLPDHNAFRVFQVMYFNNIGNFTHDDTLRVLEMLGEPVYLSASMVRLLEEIKFTLAELEPYEHSPTLKNFQYYNKSLLRFFQGKYNEVEVRNRLRGDSLTRQEISQYFLKNEVYQTIIMDGELDIRFEIPEPRTKISDFKFMYILQRIYQRVKEFNQLNFKSNFLYAKDQPPRLKEIDFSSEKHYIDREVQLPKTSPNPFHIPSRTIPRYIKLEVWKSYVFFDKDLQVDSKDLEPNHKKLTDEILNKVVKGGLYYGSYQKIREVVKEFTANQEVIGALKDAKIDFEQHGAAIEIKGSKEPAFTFICSNNTNYKLLYICAYFMAKHGSHVAVLKETQSIESIVDFCKMHFSPKQEVIEEAKPQEQPSESQAEQQ